MTSSLRRKHPITVPAWRNSPTATAYSLAALAGLWASSLALAAPGQTVTFTKPAEKHSAPVQVLDPRGPTTISSKPAEEFKAAAPSPASTVHFAKPAEAGPEQPPASAGRATQFFKQSATPYWMQPKQVRPTPGRARLPQGPAGPLLRTAMQAPAASLDALGGDTSQEYKIQLVPPDANELFRLDSEERLYERLRQEALQRPRPERITFPQEPILNDAYTGRCFPPATGIVEPFYVCYDPLLFEQRNSERWGWDLGVLQPFASAGKFFCDVALLPYKLGSMGRDPFDCNTGYCLPGDPVPLRLFPIGLSFKGILTEAATGIVLMAIFP